MATKITGTVSGEPLIQVEIGGTFYPWKQAISNWSTISATTGSPIKSSYTDVDGVSWTYYRWNNSGSVTVTAGVMDVLIVGAGADNDDGYYQSIGGSGGHINRGILTFSAGTQTITVGQSNAYGSGGSGAHSAIGSFIAGVTVLAASGSQGTGSTSFNDATGITSSITGSAVEYGRARDNTNPGGGGTTTYGSSGASGVVIVRVPTQFASA